MALWRVAKLSLLGRSARFLILGATFGGRETARVEGGENTLSTQSLKCMLSDSPADQLSDWLGYVNLHEVVKDLGEGKNGGDTMAVIMFGVASVFTFTTVSDIYEKLSWSLERSFMAASWVPSHDILGPKMWRAEVEEGSPKKRISL